MDNKFIRDAENLELQLGGKISVAPKEKLALQKSRSKKQKGKP